VTKPTLSSERESDDADAVPRLKSLAEFVGRHAAGESPRLFTRAAG